MRCLIMLLALAISTTAYARVGWRTPGSYRLRVGHVGDIPGAPDGRNFIASHRLRIDPTVEVNSVTIHMQLDVQSGQIAGDTTQLGTELGERRHGNPTRSTDGWTTVEPRLAWIGLHLPWLDAQMGQLTAQWGLGLIDGDGNDADAPDGLERFGDRVNGDIVQRAAFQVRPGANALSPIARAFTVGLGIDQVYQDEQASLLDDDDAWRAFGTLAWQGESLEVGVWVLHRAQTDRKLRETQQLTFDAYMRAEMPVRSLRAAVHLAAEGAVINGDEVGVLGRAAMQWSRPAVAVGVDAGYASGADRAFRFDPDIRAGLIYFGSALRQLSMTRAEADLTALAPDPRPTDGAITDAMFLHPILTWRPPEWRFSLGSVAVWRADAVWSGLEFDVAGHHVFGFGEVGIQAAMLLPGEGLVASGMHAAIGQVTGRLDMRW
ncbi:MAG: hypothetical protein ACI9U2_002373 [Bradymonadia bacterium]|jgi:hypothetical protein